MTTVWYDKMDFNKAIDVLVKMHKDNYEYVERDEIEEQFVHCLERAVESRLADPIYYVNRDDYYPKFRSDQFDTEEEAKKAAIEFTAHFGTEWVAAYAEWRCSWIVEPKE